MREVLTYATNPQANRFLVGLALLSHLGKMVGKEDHSARLDLRLLEGILWLTHGDANTARRIFVFALNSAYRRRLFDYATKLRPWITCADQRLASSGHSAPLAVQAASRHVAA